MNREQMKLTEEEVQKLYKWKFWDTVMSEGIRKALDAQLDKCLSPLNSEELREKIAKVIYYDCTDCPYINEGDCIEPKSCKFTLDKADLIISLFPSLPKEEEKK